MNNVLIILPAYNAQKTLKRTYEDIPKQFRDNVLLVDDCSNDETVKLAKKLGMHVIVHKKNLGYGANQKTCFTYALKTKAEIVVMVHPDYQYSPKMIAPLVEMIRTGHYDCVLGSRILSNEALKGNMPYYKYFFNRVLTAIENILIGAKISEYHTGLRAYKTKVLRNIQFTANSNSFVFDNQILLQILAKKFKIGEVSTPCKYFKEASSINIYHSFVYGVQCLYWSLIYLCGRLKLYNHPLIFLDKI